MTFDLEKARIEFLGMCEAGEDNTDVIGECLEEVERLRSSEMSYKKMLNRLGDFLQTTGNMVEDPMVIQSAIEAIKTKDARIKELEASIRQLGSLAFMGNKPLDQIIAHFIAWGQSNHEYTERLETAFLEAEAAKRYYEYWEDEEDHLWKRYPEEPCHMKPKEYYRQEARAALEELLHGS